MQSLWKIPHICASVHTEKPKNGFDEKKAKIGQLRVLLRPAVRSPRGTLDHSIAKGRILETQTYLDLRCRKEVPFRETIFPNILLMERHTSETGFGIVVANSR